MYSLAPDISFLVAILFKDSYPNILKPLSGNYRYCLDYLLILTNNHYLCAVLDLMRPNK